MNTIKKEQVKENEKLGIPDQDQPEQKNIMNNILKVNNQFALVKKQN